METDDLLLYVQQPATDPLHMTSESKSRYYIVFFSFVLVSIFHLLHLWLP